uniref:MCM9 N-terminal domain-containing protein n=1 Tax=Xiphophorus maculatus TaxID=8083 RepID=A0A3B5QVN4_XIPMA
MANGNLLGFQISATTMFISPEEEALIGRVFENYLTEHHHGDILQLSTDVNEDTHRSVVVNAMTLFEANMEVGDYFNAYPKDVLAVFDKVLQKKASELTDEASLKDKGQGAGQRSLRQIYHTRIIGKTSSCRPSSVCFMLFCFSLLYALYFFFIIIYQL